MKNSNYKRAIIFIYYSLKFLIGAGFIFSLLNQNWETAFFIALIFIFSFTPTFIKRKYRLFLPIEFDLFIVSFIFFSLFLGEIYHYYYKFWWWDLYLHTQAGFLLGMVGFLLVYIFNEQKNIKLNLNPYFTSLFAFLFSVSIGVFWEIFEFFMDSAFNLNMQKSGLTDTMWDLIVNNIGALTIAILGFLWLKQKISFSILEKPTQKFLEENHKILFKKN